MPKIPRGKDFVKFLLNIGFEILRQKGSHVILKNENTFLVIPVHGGEQLKLDLFKRLLKDIKMTDKEFWEKF